MTKTTHQTKTAKLLHHTLGDNSDITLLDNLRVTLKEKKQKKLKPSQHIVQQYNTVTAKLYLQVGSVKRETKTGCGFRKSLQYSTWEVS